ncbi:MAG: hypothetical protein LBU76_05910, partial [Azoarcus sp.]|nr:hypothetical protein [Azoarcus sp.]
RRGRDASPQKKQINYPEKAVSLCPEIIQKTQKSPSENQTQFVRKSKPLYFLPQRFPIFQE